MAKFDGYLFVSDMDATLLEDNGTVSQENQNAIKYFIDNGGLFTIASGRMIDAAAAYLDQITINAPAVLHNGAKLYDFKSGKTLYEKVIENERKELVRRVCAENPHIGIEIYCEETVYVYRPCSETERFLTKNYKVVYSLPEETWEKPWIKVLYIAERDVLDEFEKVYRSKYDKGNAVRSGDMYLDMVANGVSKGTGVLRLAELCGIKRENIIAVGDNMNDIDMINAAGHGWAVANAENDVKAAADKIAPDNNSSAIAYIINDLEAEIK